jgi:hypothetical protein
MLHSMDSAIVAKGHFTTVPVVVATAVAWLAWFGWDTQRTTDPVTGNTTGPYEWWQVAGCVLTLLGVAIYGALRLGLGALVVSMTVTFTVLWAVWAILSDDSGLWFVGALMVAAGMAVGTLLVHTVISSARRRTAAVEGRG